MPALQCPVYSLQISFLLEAVVHQSVCLYVCMSVTKTSQHVFDVVMKSIREHRKVDVLGWLNSWKTDNESDQKMAKLWKKNFGRPYGESAFALGADHECFLCIPRVGKWSGLHMSVSCVYPKVMEGGPSLTVKVCFPASLRRPDDYVWLKTDCMMEAISKVNFFANMVDHTKFLENIV